MRWLDPAPDGTTVSGGFDGSTVDDFTCIRLETFAGVQFTPRYGPDRRPTIWNPAEWGGSIPRDEVHAAWDELFRRYRFGRVYYDPPQWQSEGKAWASKYGEDVFVEWPTYRAAAMHDALDLFVTDLSTGAMRHDGCPITAVHVANARRLARPGDRYIIGKPSQTQKIDAAVTSVLAHKAAVDARSTGWGDDPVDTRVFCFS